MSCGGSYGKKIKGSISKKFYWAASCCACYGAFFRTEINSSVVVNENPAIKGMIATVKHLVRVEELD